ncbi:ArsR family transcriptional regulator [Pontibacter mucosus]|uniref:ArsR family transcriptional regulator n=1 Tax=Pontibacter mucosus TaxID=1649266 RepID=A0A2T5YHM0_9BACT|nr:metalloregulator ArsR/SmtB family transcription factor [Pontibacter mucosus]PTX18794.1 ArsR family transcriptional regulator [Pontibacter mucosus]
MDKLKVRVDQKKLERAAYVLKCLAHPVRISIIDLLEQRERLSVSQLQEVLQIEQSLLSHHLTNMRDKGLVETQREGKNVYYSLSNAAVTTIISCIHGKL